MPNKPRLAFMGTPELCLLYLDTLDQAGLAPVVVVTNPDRPVGRKQTLTPPAVKTWAQERGIPVLQPNHPKTDLAEQLTPYQLDLSIVVAYGQILPPDIINLPTRGTINVHYSLLPRWRGASPVEASILSGDQSTGVSIQTMVPALDQGPILASREYLIRPNHTSPELRTDLTQLGAELLIETLPDIIDGTTQPIPQDPTQATYCHKIAKTEAEVTTDESDEMLWRKYRAYIDWPRLYYFDADGRRTIITKAGYVDGKFVIKKILRAGSPSEEDYR